MDALALVMGFSFSASAQNSNPKVIALLTKAPGARCVKPMGHDFKKILCQW